MIKFKLFDFLKKSFKLFVVFIENINKINKYKPFAFKISLV